MIRETSCLDLLEAVLTTEEAVRLYRENIDNTTEEPLFGEINSAEEPCFHRQLERFDRFYFCKCIAEAAGPHSLETLIPLVCGNLAEIPYGRDKKVAFLRNRQASRAFERFAKYLGAFPLFTRIIFKMPVNPFIPERQLMPLSRLPALRTEDSIVFIDKWKKYELSIVLSCDIESDDGETSTTFALVYRDRLYIPTEGTVLFECKITLEQMTDIADIVDAAKYFGATVESLEALPVLFSGRADAFDMIFGLSSADFAGFFSYLALEYPQMAAIGIYDRTERSSL